MLFKDAEFILDKINLFQGLNLDDTASSSNGSGKSTVAKNAILFALYGDGCGINLKDLVHIDAKEASVALAIRYRGHNYGITRTVPSNLTVMCDGKVIDANTLTIKQNYLNAIFGTYDEFKKFRMLDTHGINLLDLGIISLRKELMNFVDTVFTNIRASLLNKKNEREMRNVDKRMYHFSLSEKRLQRLESAIITRYENTCKAAEEADKQYKICGDIYADMQSKIKIVQFKQSEIKCAKEGICPILKTQCEKISKSLSEKDGMTNRKVFSEIEQLDYEIAQLKAHYDEENSMMQQCRAVVNFLEKKERRTQEFCMKLKEAFKFKEYKYTKEDVLLYTEAIKTLDNFAAYYLNEWLTQLALIINTLLKEVNLQIEFSSDKEFMKIKNEDSELRYEQLSSGQKCFLSAVFKLAMLIHRGETSGIIICDEGLSNMDLINFKKFVTICHSLPYQFNIVYHNLNESIENTNVINIERKQGVASNKC